MIRGDIRGVLGQAPVPQEAERRIVKGALRRLERRRSVRVKAVAASLAVAAALILLVLWRDRLDTENAPPRAPAVVHDVVVGTVWTTGDARRSLPLGPHRAALAPHTRLRLAAGTPRSPLLALKQGRARFSVQPLSGGDRFAVETRQVRVEVLGTRFSVEAGARCSRVEVRQGTVRAVALRDDSALELDAGEARSFCDPLELDAAGREVQRAISLGERGERLPEAEALLAGYLAREPAGAYAEEALYFLVLVQRRQGKDDEAAHQARMFIQRFPRAARAQALRAWLDKKAQR